jgi:multidrug efflux pump subunit AcrB
MNHDETLTNAGGTRRFTDESLGIAGRTARFFLRSPLSPLFYVAMLMMGLLGLVMTPRQEDPQISVPMIDIMVQYPGASAQQVSNLAMQPLERIMSEIPGVKHVYSASQRNGGMVTVEHGQDPPGGHAAASKEQGHRRRPYRHPHPLVQ